MLPYLQAIGGVALLFIAVRLLLEHLSAGKGAHQPTPDGGDAHEASAQPSEQPSAAGSQRPARGFWSALFTILIADVTMSLDNVLAVGALAAGHLPLLVIGLLLSIGLVLLGSALVAELIRRLPWLLDVAALVLGWTGATMVLHDLRLGPLLTSVPYMEVLLPLAGVALVLVADLALRWRAARRVAVRVPA